MAHYLVAAGLLLLNHYIVSKPPLASQPVPEGVQLPQLGPAIDEDDEKPKRKRFTKNKGELKLRAYKAKNEKEIRSILERKTGLKWPSCRPKFLKGLQGKSLELDMYCRELGGGVAFEHNGEQHLKYVPFFHPNGYKDFEDQLERDQLKASLCRQHGVHLICITHLEWAKLGSDPQNKDDFLMAKLGSVL